MKYIALLRGINVGGNRKVDMKRLRALLESLNCHNVSTYLNSGNAIFESQRKQTELQNNIEKDLQNEFQFEIPTIIKTEKEIRKIANVIPENWQNDAAQKTDVAYLFPEIDRIETIDELPIKKEFADIRYVPGAIIWHMERGNVNRSHLTKVISHRYYRLMTVRNVNTARYLAGMTVQ